MLGIVESAWSQRELYNQVREQRVDICLHVRWPRVRIYVKSEVQPARYRTEVGRTSDYWKTTGIGDSRWQKSYLERETGIEPATLCLEGRCSTTELLPLDFVSSYR